MTEDSRYHYIIDNGHGRNTSGKRSPEWDNGKQLFEFKFNRQIVEELQVLLNGIGITYEILVPETRDVSLKNRCKRANRIQSRQYKKCVLFSIHGNAYKDGDVKGVETFFYPSSTSGKKVASVTQDNLIDELKWNDRGIKTAKFKILRSVSMPAVLTENGFYTNFEECMKMLQMGWIRRIAYAHYKSILEIEGLEL